MWYVALSYLAEAPSDVLARRVRYVELSQHTCRPVWALPYSWWAQMPMCEEREGDSREKELER